MNEYLDKNGFVRRSRKMSALPIIGAAAVGGAIYYVYTSQKKPGTKKELDGVVSNPTSSKPPNQPDTITPNSDLSSKTTQPPVRLIDGKDADKLSNKVDLPKPKNDKGTPGYLMEEYYKAKLIAMGKNGEIQRKTAEQIRAADRMVELQKEFLRSNSESIEF